MRQPQLSDDETVKMLIVTKSLHLRCRDFLVNLSTENFHCVREVLRREVGIPEGHGNVFVPEKLTYRS